MMLMVALPLVLFALTPGCADEEVFIDCPFSNSIEESCTSLDETVAFTLNQLKDPDKIARAEKDPKLKMALVFRWYLGLASTWANAGVNDRAIDFQVWCGPAIGSFNEFIRGTYLDPAVAKCYPDVYEANLQVLHGTRVLQRIHQVRADPRLRAAVEPTATEEPEGQNDKLEVTSACAADTKRGREVIGLLKPPAEKRLRAANMFNLNWSDNDSDDEEYE